MALMMKMLFTAVGPRTLRSFKERCEKSRKTQEELLTAIIKSNQNCAFGQKYGFNKIHSFKDFQKSVPITTYKDLEPYIEAQLNGKPAQLTQEEPTFFATTSGTTGKPKHIPVTPASRSAKSQLQREWFAGIFRDHPKIFDGKSVVVVSPEVESHAPCGTPCGAESGHGYRNMPKAAAGIYSVPYDVFAIEDYEAKYYVLLRQATSQEVTFMYSCNPSTILLLATRLGGFTEDIIRDIRDGTIAAKYDVSKQTREFLRPFTKADPKRASFLERAASKGGGTLLPKYAWPRIAAIGCWKGGSVGMYVAKFDQYFPEGVAVRDIGYYASEHRGSVPLSDRESSGVLAVPTNVYEFFPAHEDRVPQGEDLLAAHELQKGGQYYCYVTTVGGLYRYDMNDIIEVTDFYEQTPMIRFVQKGKGVVSFTGEKLYEAQVIAATEKVLASHAGHHEFIAAVGEVRGEVPRYVFLTEFETAPNKDQAGAIANHIEEELSRLNVEYASKRKSHRIDPLILRVIRSGEFDAYRKREVAKGRKDGQFKILKLTKDEKFMQEFQGELDIEATAGAKS